MSQKLAFHEAVQVGGPLVGGLLSAFAGLLFLSGGKKQIVMGQLMLASWGILAAFGAMAVAYQDVVDARREGRPT